MHRDAEPVRGPRPVPRWLFILGVVGAFVGGCVLPVAGIVLGARYLGW